MEVKTAFQTEEESAHYCSRTPCCVRSYQPRRSTYSHKETLSQLWLHLAWPANNTTTIKKCLLYCTPWARYTKLALKLPAPAQ